MFTILIVEDDVHQLDALFVVVKEYYNNKFNIFKANSYNAAIEIITKYNIDIFILDVNLSITSKDSNGILLGIYIRNIPKYLYTPIVFITSVMEKIREAISQLHCYDYISKPYNVSDVINSIDSIIKSPLIKEVTLNFKTLQGIGIKLKASEIFFFESSRYINIHSTRGIFQTSNYTLDELSSYFINTFIRCHRKYIVNINYSTNYDKSNQMLECNEVKISVGRTYKYDFEKRYLNK